MATHKNPNYVPAEKTGDRQATFTREMKAADLDPVPYANRAGYSGVAVICASRQKAGEAIQNTTVPAEWDEVPEGYAVRPVFRR